MRLERLVDWIARDLEHGSGARMAIVVIVATLALLSGVAVLVTTPLPTERDGPAPRDPAALSVWDVAVAGLPADDGQSAVAKQRDQRIAR